MKKIVRDSLVFLIGYFVTAVVFFCMILMGKTGWLLLPVILLIVWTIFSQREWKQSLLVGCGMGFMGWGFSGILIDSGVPGYVTVALFSIPSTMIYAFTFHLDERHIQTLEDTAEIFK